MRMVAMSSKRAGSLMDNFIPFKDIVVLQESFVPTKDDNRKHRKASVTSLLGHRCAFLLSYAGSLRIGDIASLTWSDLCYFNLDTLNSPSKNELMVLTLKEGKTNHRGNLLRTGILRHRDVEMCATGAVALYLFCLYNYLDYGFPDLRNGETWFYRKLIQVVGKKLQVRKRNGGREIAVLVEDGDGDGDGNGNIHPKGDNTIDGDDDRGFEEETVELQVEMNNLRNYLSNYMDRSIVGSEEAGVAAPPVLDAQAVMTAANGATFELPPTLAQNPKSKVPKSKFQRGMEGRLKDIARLPGSQGMGTAAIYQAFKLAFAETNVKTGRRKTHIGRGASAAYVLANSHSSSGLEGEIRRHGHWNHSDVLTQHYGNPFPMGAIRTIAGFNGAEELSYWIPRNIVDPPPELLERVYPGLDDAYEGPGVEAFGTGPHEDTEHLIEFMRYLRRVFLQDSVFLKERWPHLSLWDVPLFSTPSYLTFANQVRQVCREAEGRTAPVIDQRLDSVTPLLKAAIENVGKAMLDDFTRLRVDFQNTEEANSTWKTRLTSMVETHFAKLLRGHKAIHTGLALACAGLQSPTTSLTSLPGQSQDKHGASPRRQISRNLSDPLATETIATVEPGPSQPPSQPSGDPSNAIQRAQFEALGLDLSPDFDVDDNEPLAAKKTRTRLIPDYPKRTMSRGVKTVPELHEEWYVKPPTIQYMCDKWKTAWILDDDKGNERKWFSRRSHVIARLRAHQDFESNPKRAALCVDEEREYYGLSISKMADHLDASGRWKTASFPILERYCTKHGRPFPFPSNNRDGTKKRKAPAFQLPAARVEEPPAKRSKPTALPPRPTTPAPRTAAPPARPPRPSTPAPHVTHPPPAPIPCRSSGSSFRPKLPASRLNASASRTAMVAVPSRPPRPSTPAPQSSHLRPPPPQPKRPLSVNVTDLPPPSVGSISSYPATQ